MLRIKSRVNLDVKEKFKTAPPISFQIFAHIVEEKATPITEVA
jgi:hypothetical protein